MYYFFWPNQFVLIFSCYMVKRYILLPQTGLASRSKYRQYDQVCVCGGGGGLKEREKKKKENKKIYMHYQPIKTLYVQKKGYSFAIF